MHPRLIAFCLVFLTCVPVSARRYNKWLDQEVKWIASRAEVRQFKELKTDEQREEFIEAFWRRRDPTLETERNEYKEVFYERREHANQYFREGIPGWRTDRGRVYLIHGAPDREEYVSPDSTVARRGIPGSGGGSGSNLVSGASGRESIIWTYFNMPTAKYYKGRMLLVFQPAVGMTEQDMMVSESRQGRQQANQLWRRGGVQPSDLITTNMRFRLVTAGPPSAIGSRGTDSPGAGIGDFARYVEDVMRSPGEILELAEVEKMRRKSSRQELTTQVETAITYDTLPFRMKCESFPLATMSNVALAWQIGFSDLEFEKTQGVMSTTVDLVAQVRDADNGLIDEMYKVLDISHTKEQIEEFEGDHYRYVNEFNLPPGDYTVTSIMKEVGSKRLGTASQTISVRALHENRLSMSSVILSKALTNRFNPNVGTNLRHESFQILPQADSTFSEDDRIVVFFKIYNPMTSPEGGPSLQVNYKFFDDNSVVKRGPSKSLREFTDAEARTITFTSIVDISGIAPGRYGLQVSAIDKNSREYAIGRTYLEIKRGNP